MDELNTTASKVLLSKNKIPSYYENSMYDIVRKFQKKQALINSFGNSTNRRKDSARAHEPVKENSR